MMARGRNRSQTEDGTVLPWAPGWMMGQGAVCRVLSWWCGGNYTRGDSPTVTEATATARATSILN